MTSLYAFRKRCQLLDCVALEAISAHPEGRLPGACFQTCADDVYCIFLTLGQFLDPPLAKISLSRLTAVRRDSPVQRLRKLPLRLTEVLSPCGIMVIIIIIIVSPMLLHSRRWGRQLG